MSYSTSCESIASSRVSFVKSRRRLGGYPPFSDEIREYTLQRQICEARYSFAEEYWKDVSEDGEQQY